MDALRSREAHVIATGDCQNDSPGVLTIWFKKIIFNLCYNLCMCTV